MTQLILSAVMLAVVILEVIVHLFRGDINSLLGFLVACFFIAMFYFLFRISLSEYKADKDKKERENNIFSDSDRWS